MGFADGDPFIASKTNLNLPPHCFFVPVILSNSQSVGLRCNAPLQLLSAVSLSALGGVTRTSLIICVLFHGLKTIGYLCTVVLPVDLRYSISLLQA